ncbi:hypothetical protein GALL_277240 [mine drainage metagenome]|uniref:Type II toxin-antitoxin system RelE/ParE family toxin n=1 Tax=mine drainage metagenome TaxID=410659 RepID=A0A1J5R4K4_9ZZZZ
MAYQVEVERQVREFYEALGPDARKAVKRALQGLATERGDIKSLESPLDGYCRLRVGAFRILFRYVEGRRIRCVYIERRKLVYELFEEEMVRRLSQ